MEKTPYPDGSNEPDDEYNAYLDNDFPIDPEDACEDARLDDMILNSSALAQNSGKDTKYSYSDLAFDESKLNIKKDSSSNHKKHLSFSEQWEQVDELCPTCNHVTKEAKGLTKQNINKLLSLKGDPMSWAMFLLLIMCGFFAYTSYTLMTTPINCTNASAILTDQQANLNTNNQIPIITLTELNLTPINKSYCQFSNPNRSDYCQNITFTLNESSNITVE